jgi:putative DNA primase/helicase
MSSRAIRERVKETLKRNPGRVREIEKQGPSFPAELNHIGYPLTELGNARRFVRDHQENVRYVPQWNKWQVWDTKRWALDESGELQRLGKFTVENIRTEASLAMFKHDREDIERWQRRSESDSSIQAMLRLARSEPGIVVFPQQLDSNPLMMNCLNGTLDLGTSQLHEHRRDDLITKLAPVDYDPAARCPRWEEFLEEIFAADHELIVFVQKAIGYALTGNMREQAIFLLYGTGANGKTTFLETIRAMLGDYARNTNFSAFLQGQNSTARNDLARLVGARFVTASEVAEDRHLSEDVVKQITGGEPLTVRFLYGEFFEYRPQCKIFLAVNHKPVIRGTEHGIWRRIHEIPFTQTIPDAKQDRTLGEKLRDELPGIFRWAVEGCARWREPGLTPPAAVVQATLRYREEMDPLGGFLEGCSVAECSAVTPAAELYARYKQQCIANAEKPIPIVEFGRRLADRGFKSAKLGKARRRAWKGLRLRCEQDEQLPEEGHSSSAD